MFSEALLILYVMLGMLLLFLTLHKAAIDFFGYSRSHMVWLLKLGSAEAPAVVVPALGRRKERAFLCIAQSQPTKHSCSCTCSLLRLATVTPRLVCCHPVPVCKLKLPCLPQGFSTCPCPNCFISLSFLQFFSRTTS